ncbi:mercury methylation ferredoxin HgcB [Sinanaerobacter chloroacetimidivorans]|jgi:ferredoxin|uniref:4Fe-4S binding protein n=1 Tax=Sinanaerobacter chloroacetimidivorans TaxID=2818044 RepID=A0A8J7VZ58_9FIRM|nr:mercury methylation ferredoxin HgcB [Sinanaerobacter chloroacetimidivorans]MBR0596683.1 4Fe-4S binding protein [Sinanaerobacter chloroacetimidivorans]
MRYLKNVVTLKLESERCIGCGMCTDVCPHGIFSIEKGKAKVNNRDYCMECGACEKNCPAAAITVKTGVGCAAAVINGLLRGTEPSCDCSENSNSCC